MTGFGVDMTEAEGRTTARPAASCAAGRAFHLPYFRTSYSRTGRSVVRATDLNGAALDAGARHGAQHLLGVLVLDLHQRELVGDLDGPDALARDARLAGDGAHDVGRADAAPPPHADEQPRHRL